MNTFLLCAPTHFGVDYVINPWMRGNVANVDADLAMQQWSNLFRELSLVSHVTTIEQKPGLPDMVFTANAGLILGRNFVPSNFKHQERKGEEEHFTDYFDRHQYSCIQTPIDLMFEGAGDALFDKRLFNHLWMGCGRRTDTECAYWLSHTLGITVVPLNLVDDRFYHLDTCFCPLSNGQIMYYPGAFSRGANAIIAELVPEKLRIEVSEEDALKFACNAVNTGFHIFLNACSANLITELESHGYVVHETPLTEFMKAGGSAKCLTLQL